MGEGKKKPTDPLGVPVPPGPKEKQEDESEARKGTGVPTGPKRAAG